MTLADTRLAQIQSLALDVDTSLVALNSSIGALTMQNTLLVTEVATQQAEIDALKAKLASIAPPSTSAIVLPELQALTDWKQPGNAGDTGGSSTKPSGTFTLTPGVEATFSCKGAYPYNNGFWYRKAWGSTYNDRSRILYEMELQFPTQADLDASQAVEFQCQQSVGGVTFNMAWQAELRSKIWRTFDYANRAWVALPTPISTAVFLSGSWTKVSSEFQRNTDGTITHVSLTLNGAKSSVGITRPGVRDGSKDYFSHAFQLDSNKNAPPTPYVVKVRKMQVTLT